MVSGTNQYISQPFFQLNPNQGSPWGFLGQWQCEEKWRYQHFWIGEPVARTDLVTLLQMEMHFNCPHMHWRSSRGRATSAWLRGSSFAQPGSVHSHRSLSLAGNGPRRWTPQSGGHNVLIISVQTHRHSARADDSSGVFSEHQYCGTVCYCYRTRRSCNVEIPATKIHLLCADCTQTILFISRVTQGGRERGRQKKRCIWG